MINKKISVIMPVHNSEKFLKESIESILNQTLKEFEFIIVNDSSTDSSLKIINRFKKGDKRIILINNKRNIGTVKSRNKGLKLAKGKYVAVLDSDDISLKKRLEVQFNYLEKNPEIFLVGSSAIYINEEGKEIRRFRKYDNYKMLAWRLPKSCGIIHSSIMFRNNQTLFYNENFKSAHDYKFYLDLLSREKNLTNLEQFLIKHRVHSESTHTTNFKRQKFFSEKAKREHKKTLLNIRLIDKIKFSSFLLKFYLKTFREKRIKD